MPFMRLFRFLTILAVLFSPISMMDRHAAMATTVHPVATVDHSSAAPSAGHCADMDQERQRSGQRAPDIDCMMACSAIPSLDVQVEARAAIGGIIEAGMLVGVLHGLHPESDPPPPRFS